MDITLPQEKLIRDIRTLARDSLEHNQVAGRLKKLLPDRLRALKNEYRSQHPAGEAERHALSDKKYLTFLDEYLGVYEEAMRARIQYETHLMLNEARRSLRALRRRGLW